MKNYGIILVDKPTEISSFGVIHQLRKITGIKKIGHTGTLDPFASGLLPICIGSATRLANYILSADKEYIAEMELGYQTDSADLTGNKIAEAEIPEISASDLQRLQKEVLAITQQIPPRYSAIKVDGRRAYKLARAEQDFQIPARPVKIIDFEILQLELPKIVYRARVSKGTYIRTLSETIAQKLGSVGTTTSLRRIAAGNLQIAEAVPLADLNSENWRQHWAELYPIFRDYPQLILPETQLADFCHGRRFFVDFADTENALILNEQNRVFGFASVQARKVQPKIVLN
ncbi:MAG: tRNA pseudouridine(55) synthase TruB [Candidatus Cloacimonadales bacterium]